MPAIPNVGRVMVPMADQDEAIRFYTTVLGGTLVADTPFGDGDRWVEVAPPGGERRSPRFRPKVTTSPGG